MTKRLSTGDLPKATKRNVRRFALGMVRKTSNGTKLDPAVLTERIWEAVRLCCLCQPERKPAYVWGMFVPGRASDPVLRTGLADHQARFIWYGLCLKCYRTGDAPERAEARIADRHLREANTRARLDAG